MNLNCKFIFLFLCLFLIYKETDAIFRTESLFKPSARERFYDEQFSFYLKDSTKSRLSANQRALIVNLVTAAVKKVNSYNFNNYANSTTPLQSMRAIGSQFGLSTQAVGGLALASLLAYGTFASLAPNLKNEISKNLSKDDKEGLQNLVTNCMVGISDSMMKWVERSVNDLPSFPRMNAQECMKRIICEAHNQPKKYGLLGFGLQLFFPPFIESEKNTRVVSKYQLAARFGRQGQSNSTQLCAQQYDDCVINLLDISQSIAEFLF